MTLRVGIAGFGGAGRAHYSYFSCFPFCRVTKIFDIKPAGLARAAALCPQAARDDDYLRFLRDLDVVSICTPDRTHADYVVTALERGLHVLCEKPLTDSVDGIRKIAAAAAASDRVVAVLHQMRFVPLHRKIKAMLDERRLGAVSYAEGYYVHDLTHRAYAFDDWRDSDNATPLVYAGCHFVDLLRWFVGEIVEVQAIANHLAFPEYPESDLNVALLRFESGTIGKVLVAFGAAGPQDHSVRILGSKASIDNGVLFGKGGRWERVLHSPIIVQRPLLGDPNAANHFGLFAQLRRNVPAWLLGKMFEVARLLARRPDAEYGARAYPLRLYEHALACVDSVGDFLTAVQCGRPPMCGVDESARTVLACLAAVEAQRTHRPVRVLTLPEVL